MAAGSESDVFDMLGGAGGPPPGDAPPPPAAGGSDDDTVFNMLGPQGAAGPAAPKSPAAPAGPPRLRGQALTPPPPPKPPAGRPAAPAAPPEDLSLGAVASGMASNALPSLWSNLKQTAMPFLPQYWKQDVEGAKAIARGIGSKTGLLIPANAAQKAADEAPLNAIGKMYADRYGSTQGLLRTLKHDPFAVGSDAAAVASLAAGGEGLLAKVPDAAEAALLAGAGAAKQGAGLSNTLLNAAVTVPGAMRAAGKVASGAGKATQLLDPSTALAAGAGSVARGVAPLALGAVRHGVGGGLGAMAGATLPIPHVGPYIGMQAGHYLANKLLPHNLPPVVGKIGGALSRAPAKLAPLATAFSGMQPEGGGTGSQPPSAVPSAAPGQGPAGAAPPPAAPVDPGPSAGSPRDRFRTMYPHFAAGMTDDQVDAALQTPELKGLYDAQAPMGGSPGPAPGGAGSAAGAGDPGNVADVIRQAEGGHNQPVGYMPKGGGSARGAYQMINGTYRTNLRKYHPDIAAGKSDSQIDAYRNTEPGWALNDTMGRQMVGDEMAQLQHQGLAPTADNVGTLHMLGNTRLLHADPNTPIEQVTGADQRAANAGVFRNIRTAGDYLAWMHRRNQMAAAQMQPANAADGGRIGFQAGGQVIDMTERLMQRAERAQKDARTATKPLLGLSDDTVAQALRTAQRGI